MTCSTEAGRAMAERTRPNAQAGASVELFEALEPHETSILKFLSSRDRIRGPLLALRSRPFFASFFMTGFDILRAVLNLLKFALGTALAIRHRRAYEDPVVLDKVSAWLATLKTVSHAAATAADVLSKAGRPVVLPRDRIQGLARVYRTSTGAKPGRGAGPFADFASVFAPAVGKTGSSRRGLS